MKDIAIYRETRLIESGFRFPEEIQKDIGKTMTGTVCGDAEEYQNSIISLSFSALKSSPEESIAPVNEFI
jgi:hypothetical protein